MPYTKEQLRVYWQTHKDQLNQKRRQKRKLVRLAAKEVSHLASQVSQIELKRVSHGEVSQKLAKVSHGKPIQETANPKLTRLIQEWQTSTNYSCAPGCSADKYCSNCWYFSAGEFIDYKEAAM